MKHPPQTQGLPLWKRCWRRICQTARVIASHTLRPKESTTMVMGTNRRQLLQHLAWWPIAGLFAGSRRVQAAPSEVPVPQGGDKPILITESDAREYHRVKNLDLGSARAATKQKNMPVGKIAGLPVSRLISGSNLISMNMHARDLGYVRTLAAHYNTEERVFLTLKKCEELGVNTIVLKNHNFKQFKLKRYWQDWGGKMQWIADVITTDINKYEQLVVEHLELGAAMVYLWGGASDTWYHQKKPGNIIKAYEIMRKFQVPVGICAHRLEPIAFCEKEGLKPDFYMKTLHHDRYWSAHPSENRRFMEMYEKESEDHAEYHDNLFCHNTEETIAFMQNLKVPWIAFKVLAAGAIPPQDGIRYAFANGADFICLGMFDFQVESDADLVVKAADRLQQRPRAWA